VRVFALIAVILILASTSVDAYEIVAVGGWWRMVTSADLVGGAGTDLVSTYEGSANESVLSISGCSEPTDPWRVDVRKTDTNWHGDLALSVRRVSGGDGLGAAPSGGDTYVPVGSENAEFFWGWGDRRDICVQYRLSGMSVRIPPGIYSTTVTYTVVDL
jgi:hypothetical protein